MAKIWKKPTVGIPELSGTEPPNDILQLEAVKSTGESLTINGGVVSSIDLVRMNILAKLRRFPYKTLRRFPLLDKICPFCKTRLSSLEHSQKEDEEAEEYWFEPLIAMIEFCKNCLYWKFHHLETYVIDRGGIHEIHTYTSHISKLREFDTKLPDNCSSELAQWLRRDDRKFHLINPTRLEKLVADIFKANYREAEVTHVGRPDDGGVDVIFVDTEDRKWLIQVKRREKPLSSEPVETIRNLLGTLLLEESRFGIIVSTADHFTYRAYIAANRARERGMTIELIDKGKLRQMLGPILPDQPWLNLIGSRYPEMLTAFSREKAGAHNTSIYRQLKLF